MSHSRHDARTLSIILIGALGVVAFLARLLPLLTSGTLGGFRGYDDGVHYAAGVHLLAGSWPYRDYVLVHPPGIAILMLPFALIGRLVGDPEAVSAARVFFAMIGSLNTVLIGILLKRWGYAAVIFGAGLYALGSMATIAERSIMLSPILGTCGLAALVVLQRGKRSPRRSVSVAGIFLGVALCFKLWAILLIFVVAVMILVNMWPRMVTRFLALCAAVCTLVMGVFFILAPVAMFTDVVLAQLARTDGAAKGMVHRINDFIGGGASLGTAILIVSIGLAGLAVAAAVGINRNRNPRKWGEEFWWALTATVAIGALLMSASFFDHYPNFAAPYLALCLGTSVGAGVSAISRRVSVRNLGAVSVVQAPSWAATAVGVLLLVPVGVQGMVLNPAPWPNLNQSEVEAATAPYDCVFSAYSYMGIVSNSLSRSMKHDCGSVVDVFGSQMVEDVSDSWAARYTPKHSHVRELQVNDAQAAVVVAPAEGHGLSTSAVKTLREHFELSTTSGSFQVWVKR